MTDRIFAPQLIDEMNWRAKKYHAEVVYSKCIKAGRYKWAAQIAHRYGLTKDRASYSDDRTMALEMAIAFP